MSGSQPADEASADARSLGVLRALDQAFEQTVGSRFGGSIGAVSVLPSGTGPVEPLRSGAPNVPGLLIAYATSEPGAASCASLVLRGWIIGRLLPGSPGGGLDPLVLTDLVDPHDPNHQEGDLLHGGVGIVPDATMLRLVRSSEQADAHRQQMTAQARGQIPPAGRHRPRAGLGLGGGSHRPALGATVARPIAGRLLGALGRQFAASKGLTGAVIALSPS